MSRSCACLSGPPVSRTADKGSGCARYGTAFLIASAPAIHGAPIAAMRIIAAIGHGWPGEGETKLFLNIRIRLKGVRADVSPSDCCHVHSLVQAITRRPDML